jgi:hypothetical protein
MSRASRTVPLLLAFALVAALVGCSSTGGRNAANPPDTTADSGLSNPDTTTETLPETTDTTQAEELDLKVGDTAEYTDGVRMTVLGLQRDVQPSYRDLLSNPKAKVLAVTVKIVNGSSKSFDLSVTLNLVYGQDGREAEAFFDSAKGINGIDSPSRLRPKRAVTGKFAFEVPSSNVKELVFEGAPGFDYDAQQWTA